MVSVKRLASSWLLALGIVLVFAGMSASLGFTGGGMVASVAAIVALLYAGGIWFGSPAAVAPAGTETVFVFDRALRVAAGAAPGTPLLSRFPEPMQAEIGARCRAALRGEATHFRCDHAGYWLEFDVTPVHTSSGPVLYGVLICGRGAAVAAAASSPLTTTIA
jgi:hypothetical protein